MRVKYEFLTAVAFSALLAACGSEPVTTDTGSNTMTARSDIDTVATDSETVEQAEETPMVFEDGVSNFEAWAMTDGVTVRDAAATAPDESRSADLLRLGTNGVLGWANAELPVESGDGVEGGVWLWAPEDTQVVLQLVRWCSDTESEVATEVVSVTNEPARFSVDHTFEYAHECVRFQIAGNGADTTVYAWNASVNRLD